MEWQKILKQNENMEFRQQDRMYFIYENGKNSDWIRFKDDNSESGKENVLNAYRQFSTMPSPTLEQIVANDSERARFIDWYRNWSPSRGTDNNWITQNVRS